MRFKSTSVGGFQVFSVSGSNTISFAIAATAQAKVGLLGFAVERIDPAEKQRYFMLGFKVFRSLVPNPTPNMHISTWDHPVQSFVWDDFTAKPDREYEYVFYPLRGSPKNLDRGAAPLHVRVRTEALYGDSQHDVFFNRGVASSQAYTRQFGNKKPSQLLPQERDRALHWLARDLQEALLKFIAQPRAGDGLLCCFYEFSLPVAAEALKEAIDRGVDVKVIIDAKENEHTDKQGFHPSFPRTENLDTIKQARIPRKNIIMRDKNPANIQHNKFMVLLKGKRRKPAEVWTGSTNLSLGGMTGQTNVGHWVRSETVAARFQEYWNLLATNPGSAKGGTRTDATRQKSAYRKAVQGLTKAPDSIKVIQKGITPIFSPRPNLDILTLYTKLVSGADDFSAITLAFGISGDIKKLLKLNTTGGHIVFLLLEKEDRPNKRNKEPFVVINASNNVYKAWGSFIEEAVYQWARETNTRVLQLSHHVSYIHSKFLLMDPLSTDPVVVTGSANFSRASTTDNDENMLIIRGNQRVADIYFTEFNRLFNHYYFRSVLDNDRRHDRDAQRSTLFLDETSAWLNKYAPGKLRAKRVEIYRKMKGFTNL
jgi:phosphatidylserine/phosphatidylglycerophosphate/cardiolipin synthase-like enzyme